MKEDEEYTIDLADLTWQTGFTGQFTGTWFYDDILGEVYWDVLVVPPRIVYDYFDEYLLWIDTCLRELFEEINMKGVTMTQKTPEMDFEGDAAETLISEEGLSRLSSAAAGQVQLERGLRELEEKQKELSTKLRILSEETIPTLMAELGVESFVLADGTKVAVEKKIHASITEANRSKAHAWLRDNGHGSLIKNQVTCDFGRGEETKAEALVTHLDGQEIVYKRKEAVHPQTLGAFVREQMGAGNVIPIDLFGIYESKKSKVEIKK